MKAAVTTAPGTVEIVGVPVPVCGPDQVRIKVLAVGLCGSDYHLFSGKHPYATFPRIQGHEFSGSVAELGSGYSGHLRIGDLVVVEPLISCGRCFACRRGRYNCCAFLKVMGAHVSGALAEEVVVGSGSVHPVGLAAEVAALVEPVSIGLQAARRGNISADDKVVVLGAGPVGLAAALAADDFGAEVMVVDRVSSRLTRARAFGVSATVDSSTADLTDAVGTWTDGDGAAVVIDATGAPALIRLAFDAVAPSGSIVVVGISDGAVEIPVIEFTRKEVSVYGSRNNTGIFGDAIDLVERNAGTIAELITHRFPLDAVGEAMRFAQSHPDLVEKVLITVGGSE